jgi:hypothetical protein
MFLRRKFIVKGLYRFCSADPADAGSRYMPYAVPGRGILCPVHAAGLGIEIPPLPLLADNASPMVAFLIEESKRPSGEFVLDPALWAADAISAPTRPDEVFPVHYEVCPALAREFEKYELIDRSFRHVPPSTVVLPFGRPFRSARVYLCCEAEGFAKCRQSPE